jgi:hypothetical protein
LIGENGFEPDHGRFGSRPDTLTSLDCGRRGVILVRVLRDARPPLQETARQSGNKDCRDKQEKNHPERLQLHDIRLKPLLGLISWLNSANKYVIQ